MASMARKITGRAIRKIHVPAYCPSLVGVQELEYRGVAAEVKKTMAISAMDMLMPPMECPDDMSMPPMSMSEEVAIVMPDEVAVMAISVVAVMPLMLDISIVANIGRPLNSAKQEMRDGVI